MQGYIHFSVMTGTVISNTSSTGSSEESAACSFETLRIVRMLTRKNQPFVFGPEQISAQDDLRQALIESPALRPIDYTSTSSVILAVDTSQIAIRFHLCQCSPDDPQKRYYARFGSITLNDRESRFSQPKLELYGLFRSLRALKLYLIGVLCQSIHRHDSPPQVKQLQVYSTGPLFTHALCRVPSAACGNHCNSRRMVVRGHLVQMGDDIGDRNRQWASFRQGPRLP